MKGPRSLAELPRSAFVLRTLWALVIAFLVWYAVASPRYAHVDFVAFYCAGQSIAHGADPYREMPLNACEQVITSEGLYATGTTVPAPLPPYAVAALAPLTRLPFDGAYLVFTSLSLAAIAFGCRLLSQLTGASMTLIVAAVASTALDNVRKGQPIPLLFLAIAVTGWALARGRDRLAAVFAAGTMIEPHVGLTLCAAMFFWRPKTRLVLLMACGAFMAFSFAVVPPRVAVSYLTEVLPLHAASEATWITQLSLVSPLVFFGVRVGTALELATIQYLAFGCAGVYVAGRLSRNAGAPESIAFIAPLFAMFGGPYIHSNLLLMGIPAAIFMVRRFSSAVAFAALAAIAISWLSVSEPVPFVVAVVVTATIAFEHRSQPFWSVASAVVVIAIGILHGSVQGAPRRASGAMHLVPTAYAERSWAEFVGEVNPPAEAQLVAQMMKLPTWAGLLFLSGLAVYQVRPRAVPKVHVAAGAELHEPA